MRKTLLISLWFVAVLLMLPIRVEAGYIDPNTGGMIFAALAGAFTVISGAVLVYASRIRAFFARQRRKMRGDSAEPETISADESVTK